MKEAWPRRTVGKRKERRKKQYTIACQTKAGQGQLATYLSYANTIQHAPLPPY